MAHEVENMFFTGATPWHGLGRRLPENPTIYQAIEAAGLDWEVKVRPLYYFEDEPKVHVDKGEGFQVVSGGVVRSTSCAVVRETDGAELGVVKPGYTPLQNRDAFELYRPLVEEGLIELVTAGSLRGGKHVWILGEITGDPAEIVPGDQVNRYLIFVNAHDGSLAAMPGLCPIRVVCANTLAAAMEASSAVMVKAYHTKRVKENVQALWDSINIANRRFEASVELYSELAKRDIDQDTLHAFVKMVFGKKKRSKELQRIDDIRVDNITVQVESLFESGKGSDIKGVRGTWWGAYNSITEYLNYVRGRSNEIRLDSVLFGEGRKYSERALATAQEMALN